MGGRTTVQSRSDLSVFSTPACRSSPLGRISKKRKKNQQAPIQAKKTRTVSWKDLGFESPTTTAHLRPEEQSTETDASECSVNEKKTYVMLPRISLFNLKRNTSPAFV